MWHHKNLTPGELAVLIRARHVTLAGYAKGKIYGTLDCASGRTKMKRENRVFFRNEAEALAAGYRPCAVCCNAKYLAWKNGPK